MTSRIAPIPGDPAVVVTGAKRLATTAVSMTAAADQVRRVTSHPGAVSEALDALAGEGRAAAAQLEAVAMFYETASTELGVFAQILEDAQVRARNAHLAEAEQLPLIDRAEFAAERDSTEAMWEPDPVRRQILGQQAQAWSMQAKEYAHQLDLVRGVYDAAVADVEEAATTTARRISLAGDGMGNHGSAHLGLATLRSMIDALGARGPVPAPPEDASPETVKDWWDLLTPAQREAIAALDPDSIRNLDGIPFAVRGELNEDALARELALVAAALAGPCTEEDRVLLLEREKALQNTQIALDTYPESSIALLDVSGPRAKIAVAFGDVDTADHVAVFTPGIGSRPDNDLYADDMHNIYAMGTKQHNGTVATIAWLGYVAPNGLDDDYGISSTQESYGTTGAPLLTSFYDAVDATNPGVHLTALGHSYGSFVTGLAAQETTAIDSMVVYGSPGLGTNDADDFSLADGQVFIMQASEDPVADLGYYGYDPDHLPGFTHLSTSESAHGTQSVGHSEYMKQGTTAQWNLASVVAGTPEVAVQGSNSGVGDEVRAVGAPVVDYVQDSAPGAPSSPLPWNFEPAIPAWEGAKDLGADVVDKGEEIVDGAKSSIDRLIKMGQTGRW